jgi:hypothetical protein
VLRRLALLVASLSLAACVEEPVVDVADLRVTPPPPPAAGEGLQFVMPETVIKQGEEKMICWIPDFEVTETLFVSRFEGLQADVGHHVVALQSAIPREVGSTFDCTQIEQMASMRPLVLPDPTDTPTLPPGFAVRMDAGAKIVIQSHYVNYTDSDILVADVARFTTLPEAEVVQEASYLILNSTLIDIPAGQAGTVTKDCDIPGEMRVLTMLGHMHELGKSLSVVSGEEALYNIDAWTSDMRDVPPLNKFTAEEALVLNAGQRLTLTCNFENTRDHRVGFPEEMCTSVSYYFPALPEGMILCEDD